MDKPIRVLQVGMTSNRGGIESYIMELYRNIDREKVQFDFLTLKGEPIAYQDEIEALGGRIFDVTYRKRDIVKHYFRFPFLFFKKHPEITVVHFHKTSVIDIEYIILSWISKVPIRIVHSHSSGNMFKSGKFVQMIEKWNFNNLNKFLTHKFACSEVAGNWLFKDGKFQIVKNSIDTDIYIFDDISRNEFRKRYKIDDDCTVIGHIGYFTEVKNHEFIINMFLELLKKNSNSKLLLIGDGVLKTEIEKKIELLGFEDKVIFTGNITEVSKYLNMMDIFILPSKFEGFPISVIEAQCNGLPVLLSDSITEEVKLTTRCRFLSINEPSIWVDEIIKIKDVKSDRLQGQKDVIEFGYDIKFQALKMQKFYQGIERKELKR